VRTLSPTRTPERFSFWVLAGTFWLVFQLYVLGRWVTGPYFVAVDPGSDPISAGMQTFLLWAQILCSSACVLCLWLWVVVPWRREGRLNSDAMIAISAATVWFWDFSQSYVVDGVLYNAHLFNRGSWGLHAWPGWLSPGGHIVAEPLLFVPAAYIVLVLSQVVFVCWLLRKIKSRRPDAGVRFYLAAIFFGLLFVDTMVETTVLRTGLYAYPAAIRAFSLFPGETYQFPLSEGILFGGLSLGAIAVLKFFKDDRGSTFVERGIEKLGISETRKQLLRLLAIYGWIHSAFFVLFMVPNTVVTFNGDAYPEGYPSYLLNGMCQYGERRDQCPGPGVSIPRPSR
jgi:Spirocyclase AveC-like